MNILKKHLTLGAMLLLSAGASAAGLWVET